MQITTFSNGVLSLTNDSYICKYRCFEFQYRNFLLALFLPRVKFHEWRAFKVQANISCEFFEVSCGVYSYNLLNIASYQEHYRMPYAQAVRKQYVAERTRNDLYRPSVVVILLDSVSHSTAERRLPQTLKFLKEQLNLTVFDGYAKVGLNSNPNGMAFLTGKMKEPPFGKKSDAGSNDDVKQQIIWNEFKKRGFVTFFSEDDIINSIFDEFSNAPTDHFFGPFWTHMNSIQAWPHAPHQIALTYMNQLLKIYQNNPLFAVLWISSLSHDQVNDLDDSFFLDFFQKSKDLLKDSFLIFMGDHGMRFGGLRSSVPGFIKT
uniref:Uncharacterized protein n=1 Tax=Plectus sambesii TaxID=2011161 RepID=A0A914VUV1_9BILA